MRKRNPWMWMGLAFAACVFAACGGGGGGDSGTLRVSLTDSTLPGFQAIYVTVEELQAHKSGGDRATVGTPRRTVNLLELVNGVREELGVAALESGHYTQLRLILGTTPDATLNRLSAPHPFANYFIDDTGAAVELKVPSGLQTGVKIVRGFDINEGQTTELLLDFDAARSVVMAGASGQWLLKPTIKVLGTSDFVVVSGTVVDAAAGQPLAGVTISAQRLDATAVDEKDAAVVEAATLTGAQGHYALFIAPGNYALVAFREVDAAAFEPACAALSVAAGDTAVRDFALSAAAPVGAVAGTVTIAGAPADQHATLSFRRGEVCGEPTPVELTSRNVAAGGSYHVGLPAAAYRLVASSFDRTTQGASVAVSGGATTTADFGF